MQNTPFPKTIPPEFCPHILRFTWSADENEKGEGKEKLKKITFRFGFVFRTKSD